MGGVDALESLVSNYHIGICGKKWYWPYFINTIDVLKSAAFKIYKIVNPKSNIDFSQFIQRAVIHYLKVLKILRLQKILEGGMCGSRK